MAKSFDTAKFSLSFEVSFEDQKEVESMVFELIKNLPGATNETLHIDLWKTEKEGEITPLRRQSAVSEEDALYPPPLHRETAVSYE